MTTVVQRCVFSVVVLGAIPCGAAEPTSCRVRFVKAATAESVASGIIREVESWIGANGRGCVLVSSVAEANVVLELEAHSLRFDKDIVPVETWQFVARQFTGANPKEAIQRFGLTAIGGQDSKDRLAERLPVVLKKLLGKAAEAPKAVERI